MRALTAAGLTGLALVALTACHRHEEASSSPPASSAVVATAPSAAPPAAVAPAKPHRQPGLWELHESEDGLEGVRISQLCVDAKHEDRLSLFSARVDTGHCDTNQIMRKTDGTWAFSYACDMSSGGKVTGAGVITGDVGRAYTVQVDTNTVGAGTPQENGEHKINITETWQGPCRPGQKGGDYILPGGIKMNVLAGLKE